MGHEANGNGAHGALRFDIERDLLCVSNAQGYFVSLNGAWEKVLGWTREQLQARPFIEFVHPDDVDATVAAANRISDRDAELSDFITRWRTAEGEYRWLSWSARTDGDAWFAVAFDVTSEHEREEELRRILQDDQLLAYSQPILDQRQNRISHEELLARLRGAGPGDEVIQPAAFVPDAERLGLIGIVDRWMLRQALAVAEWSRATTVNISARSIDDPVVLEDVCELVEGSPGAAQNLIFELTETAALEHLDAALELTQRLAPLGCAFALDDFGTGFGSLTYLRHLPVQFLKIDTAFVRGIAHNRADQELVRSVVAIAAEMGIRTVAEGVENTLTLQLLRDYSVDHVQGYLIGEPEPIMN
jgi:PAS domain S-box-containing protein